MPFKSVQEIFVNDDFRGRVLGGLVFVHDKRPASDRLIFALQETQSADFKVAHLSELSPRFDHTVDALVLKRRRRTPSTGITVIDCDAVPTSLPKLVLSLASAPGLRTGAWLRGHLRDLHPTHIRMLDAVFIWDLAADDAETLRSVLAVTEDDLTKLRSNIRRSDDYYPPPLAWVSGIDRHTRRHMSEPADNPSVLPVRPEDGVIRDGVYLKITRT